MAKEKVLGEQYGITITRPWNNTMYEHNEKIAECVKGFCKALLLKFEVTKDLESLKILGKSINGYGYGSGMNFEDILKDAERGLDRVQNHWLHSDVLPDLLKHKFIKPIDFGFVGYDKL